MSEISVDKAFPLKRRLRIEMQERERLRILVTGATGFIGKPVVRCLLQRGWNVRAMVRKSSPLPSCERLQVVYGDMCDPHSLEQAMKDVAVVVHLAAAKGDEKCSAGVNIGGAVALVAACRSVGCARVINISSQSVKIPRKGTYAHTKSEADRVFEKSGLQVTTLLPSIVYGEERSGVFGALLKVVKELPIVPVLGSGKWICGPVYVGDVAKAISLCIENDYTIGKTYDIGGPNLITLDTLIDKVAGELGLRRRKVHIPFRLSLLCARALATLLSRPPISISNVLGSNQDTHLDIGPISKDLGFNPIDLDTGLKKVLNRTTHLSTLCIPDPLPHDADLAIECSYITRYLIDQLPPKELVDRYVTANRILFREDSLNPAQAELRFVRRHPSMLPLIDAATAVVQRDSLVRKKVLLMTAILEATPTYADFFLPETGPRVLICWKLVWQGIRSATKIALGVPVLWIARRS